MKNYLILFFLLISFMMGQENLNGQAVKREDWTLKKAKTWFNSSEWKKGWNVDAHPSVNIQEFAYQYHKNKALWDKAFSYLKSTRLDTLSPGKHFLDGDNLFVSVTDGPVKNFEDTKWEAHKKYIDLQYVILGKEKMGIIPVKNVSVLEIFDETKDVGFYTAQDEDAKFYEATPEVFFLFFPGDAHRPMIKVEGFDSDKKLVVKIKAD